MSFIPQSFIDELLARVDIVEVINSRVPLKKTGRNYMACCPFHNEKTPSFSVVPDKQFYNCFGCQSAGSALKFVMTFDNLDFVDAVQKLANEVNLELPKDEKTYGSHNVNKYDNYFQVLKTTANFYQKTLYAKNSLNIKQYLINRGIDHDIANYFLLGYAPDGWDNLKNIFVNSNLASQNVSIEGLLEQTGLWIRKDTPPENNKNNYRGYDRFRSRLMFPIRDIKGRVIAFGGRVTDDSKPKYLNSPETVLFHKSSELYGLYESLDNSYANKTKINRFVIVEGYLDVISLFQHGICYSVATLGTATSYRHLAKLFKHCSEVIYCFDGDAAGKQAAWRALENSLPALYDGRVIKFLFLPEDHDPDSYVRKFGKSKFIEQMDKAINLSDYLFSHQEQQLDGQDLSTVEGRVNFVKLCKPLINKLPVGTYKTILEETLAQKCHLTIDKINSILVSPDSSDIKYQKQPGQDMLSEPDNIRSQPEVSPNRTISFWRRVCLLLVQYPRLLELIPSDLIELVEKNTTNKSSRGIATFYSIYQYLDKFRGKSMPNIIDDLHNESTDNIRLRGIIMELLNADSMVTNEQAEQEFKDILSRIRKEMQSNEMNVLKQKVVSGGMSCLTIEEKRRLQELLATSL